MKSTFDELLVFVTIADCGSIVKTAEQLNQTTSAISRTLQRLEKKLNVKLIERTTRSLNLTYDGKIFLERARKLLSDLNEAEELLINPGTEPTGLIKIDSAT
ncbi:MAG: LysR family transcriptional regulator, partial [Acinetobacter sp.]